MQKILFIFNKKKEYLLFILFFLLSLIIFSSLIHYPFFWDDKYYLQNYLPGASSIWETLETSWPLTFITFNIEKKIFNDSTQLYRYFTIVIHSLNATILYYLIKQILNRKLSLIIALLFLVHPVNYFCLSQIFQQKTLLATLLFELSVLFYLKRNIFFKSPTICFWISIICFFVSTQFKPSFTFIIIPILIFRKKINLIKDLYYWGFYIFIALFSFITTFRSLHPFARVISKQPLYDWNITNEIPVNALALGNMANNPFSHSIIQRTIDSITLFVKYTVISIFSEFPQFFPQKILPQQSLVNFTISFTIISLLILTIIKYYNKKNIISFSTTCFLFSIFPFCLTFNLPALSWHDYAQYWLYPYTPFIILSVILIIKDHFNEKTPLIFSSILLLIFLITTQKANLRYKDYTTSILGTRDISETMDIPIIYNSLAYEYLEKKKNKDALYIFEKLVNDKRSNNQITRDGLKYSQIIIWSKETNSLNK